MYELRAPAEPLRRFIEHYWFVSAAPGEPVDVQVDVFVDGRADLIFNFGAPYVRRVIGGTSREFSHSNLDAQRLQPIRIEQRGQVRIAGVRFHLGGLGPFVRGPLRQWTDQTPRPEEVFGCSASELEGLLARSDEPDAQARLFDSFFLAQLELGAAFGVFEVGLAMLVESVGSATVEALAARAAVSTRQIDRLFARHLGIPPKTVGRILRFQSSLRALMRDPGCSLAEVAAAAGYFDQAHFIKDFKRMSGGVPRGYRGYYPPVGPHDFAPNVVVFLQDGELPVT